MFIRREVRPFLVFSTITFVIPTQVRPFFGLLYCDICNSRSLKISAPTISPPKTPTTLNTPPDQIISNYTLCVSAFTAADPHRVYLYKIARCISIFDDRFLVFSTLQCCIRIQVKSVLAPWRQPQLWVRPFRRLTPRIRFVFPHSHRQTHIDRPFLGNPPYPVSCIKRTRHFFKYRLVDRSLHK